VFVQLVIAAITTEPSANSNESPLFCTLACFAGFGERFLERDLGLRERHAVLRALGPGHRGHHRREIEFQLVRKNRIGRLVRAEKSLLLCIGFDELHLRFAAIGEAQVGERLRIHGEESHRRAIFGGHVGDRGAVGKREARKARPVELHKFSDDAFLAQHLGHGQHQVGRGGPFGQPAVQLEADHGRNQHREGLAQHRGLRLDAAHAPAQNAQAVDHRGVGIGADKRVGETRPACHPAFRVENHAREVFEIHLVADAGIRRHHPEIL
jgi:hypothetical protein